MMEGREVRTPDFRNSAMRSAKPEQKLMLQIPIFSCFDPALCAVRDLSEESLPTVGA